MRSNRRIQIGLCAAMICCAIAAQAQHTADQARSLTPNAVKSARCIMEPVAKATATKPRAETPSWETLQAAYDYDRTLAAQIKAESAENAEADQWNLSFTGPDGKPVSGIFLRPKGEGVVPCALLLHGLTNNKELVVKEFGNALLAKGIAVLALDAPMHGEQKIPGKNLWTEQVIRTAVHEGARDYRCALDYLATRTDIDNKRIGLIGLSLGGIEGSVLGGVDDRISAFVFCLGGDPILPLARLTPNDQNRKQMMEVSPSLFIGHIAPRPILMVNARKDAVIPVPAAKMLYNAAKEPKQIEWTNGVHEFTEDIGTKAVEWLASKLTATAPSNGNVPPPGPTP